MRYFNGRASGVAGGRVSSHFARRHLRHTAHAGSAVGDYTRAVRQGWRSRVRGVFPLMPNLDSMVAARAALAPASNEVRPHTALHTAKTSLSLSARLRHNALEAASMIRTRQGSR